MYACSPERLQRRTIYTYIYIYPNVNYQWAAINSSCAVSAKSSIEIESNWMEEWVCVCVCTSTSHWNENANYLLLQYRSCAALTSRTKSKWKCIRKMTPIQGSPHNVWPNYILANRIWHGGVLRRCLPCNDIVLCCVALRFTWCGCASNISCCISIMSHFIEIKCNSMKSIIIYQIYVIQFTIGAVFPTRCHFNESWTKVMRIHRHGKIWCAK